MRKRVAPRTVSKAVRKVNLKDRAADLRMRREYHLTLDEYNLVFRYQGSRCAICKQPVKTGRNRLAIDHCHLSGLLRGLLCWRCNKSIAVFQDDVERLKAAVEYLKFPPVSVVLRVNRYTAPGRVGTKKRAKLLLAMKAVQGTKSKEGV